MTIVADGEPSEVPARALTLLAHNGSIHLQVPQAVEINAGMTLEWAAELEEQEWELYKEDVVLIFCWHYILGEEIPYPRSAEDLRSKGMGCRHLYGMLVLMFETMLQHKIPYLRMPESFLHPRAQSNLGSILSILTGNPPLFQEMVLTYTALVEEEQKRQTQE